VGGRAGGVRTLLQPARAQCLRLSERFFIYVLLVVICLLCAKQKATYLLTHLLTYPVENLYDGKRIIGLRSVRGRRQRRLGDD